MEQEVDIIEAADGGSAMARLSDRAPEIIFISQRLPGLDGARFLSWLEASGRKSLCALLADSIKADWTRIAVSVKAYDVLRKPVTSEAVERLLRSYRRMVLPARVALVCESSAVADVLSILVRKSRFALVVDRYETLQQTVRALESRSYDLAIVDQPSDAPALEAVAQIAARSNETRFILLGAEAEETVRSALSTFGIAAYLQKPFGVYHLDEALHRAFGLWRPYLFNSLLGKKARRALDSGTEERIEVPASDIQLTHNGGSALSGRRTPSGRIQPGTIQTPKPDDPFTALFEVRLDTGYVGRFGVDRALLARDDQASQKAIEEKQRSGDLPAGSIVSVARIVSSAWLE